MADPKKPIRELPGGQRTTIDPTDAFIIQPLVGDTAWIDADTILSDFNDGLKFACKVTHSTTQSLPTATNTPLDWDQETFDFGGFHDNVTNNSRLTIPAGQGGIYRVAGQTSFASNASGIRDCSIVKNGVTTIVLYRLGNPVTGSENLVAVETIVELLAGDYVEFFGNQTSGGNLNAQQIAIMNEFFIHLLARVTP